MGNKIPFLQQHTDYYVYKRLNKNNKYSKEPEQIWRNISHETSISRFKHEMYGYIFKKYNYEGTRAIYLYRGNKRIMRIEILNNQVVVQSKYHLQEFIDTDEELSPQRHPKLESEFYKVYCKNYARLDVDKIAYILNTPPQDKNKPYEEQSNDTEQ